MEISLSIIIPAYNVQEYIERCILSIAKKDIDMLKIEIIVINDGSTDNTSRALEKLKNIYPSIIILNKPNGGLSSARNAGLDIAKGKYIMFVDADDYLIPHSIPQLLDILKKIQPDIILYNSIIEKNKHRHLISFHLPESNLLLPITEYINRYTILSAAWQGLFRKELFDQHDIRMPEGKFAEDDDLVIKLFSVANTIYYMPTNVYMYCSRENSISNNRDKAHIEKLISDRISIFKELTKYVNLFSDERKSGLERKLNFLALDIVRLLIRKSCSDKIVSCALDELINTGYYPLKKNHYSFNYKFFSYILSQRSYILFFSQSNFFKIFF